MVGAGVVGGWVGGVYLRVSACGWCRCGWGVGGGAYLRVSACGWCRCGGGGVVVGGGALPESISMWLVPVWWWWWCGGGGGAYLRGSACGWCRCGRGWRLCRRWRW